MRGAEGMMMDARPTRRRRHDEQKKEESRNAPVCIRVLVDDVVCCLQSENLHMLQIAPLAASIARHGLLQPIVVRRRKDTGRYAVVLGERRLAALRLLGWKETDAILVDADEAEAAACFLEDCAVSAYSSAVLCAKRIEKTDASDIEQAYALNDNRISRLQALMHLHERTKKIVESAHMSLEQAEPLLKINNEQRQIEAAAIIAERELTPAQARRLVCGPQRACMASAKEHRCTRRRATREAMEEVTDLAERLQKRGIGAAVSVHSLEGGMCIQLMLQKTQNESGQKEFERKHRS